jgi:AcrR family transcriptional regulator
VNGQAGEASTRKARETRAAILAAAARLFAERGFSDVSLREIAAAAGMQAGSVYYHFSSKDALLDAVLDTGVDRMRGHLQAALADLGAGTTVEARLRTAIRVHVGSLLDIRDDANTFLRVAEHLPPAMKVRGRGGRRDYALIWRDLLAEGQRTGEVDQAIDLGIFVPFLLQGLNQIPEWFSPSRMTIQRVCEVIFATTLRSIVTAPEARARTR